MPFSLHNVFQYTTSYSSPTLAPDTCSHPRCLQWMQHHTEGTKDEDEECVVVVALKEVALSL